MRLGDLSTEQQADTAAARLGGKERREQVARVGQAGPAIQHVNLNTGLGVAPAEPDSLVAAGCLGGFTGILDEVDQQLFQLRCVGVDLEIASLFEFDGPTGFQCGHSAQQLTDSNRGLVWCGQPGQFRITAHELAERLRPVANDIQSCPCVAVPVRRARVGVQQAG